MKTYKDSNENIIKEGDILNYWYYPLTIFSFEYDISIGIYGVVSKIFDKLIFVFTNPETLQINCLDLDKMLSEQLAPEIQHIEVSKFEDLKKHIVVWSKKNKFVHESLRQYIK